MKKTKILIACITLSACGISSKDPMGDIANAFAGIPTSKQVEEHKRRCTRMGFKEGSDKHADCMLKLYDAHVSRMNALRAKQSTPITNDRPIHCTGNNNGAGYQSMICH